MKLLRLIKISGLAIMVAGAGSVMFNGYVVVEDQTGRVAVAALKNQTEESKLLKVGFGHFIGIANLEGTIEITCNNGHVFEVGYVTPSINTTAKIQNENDCNTSSSAP